MTPIWKESSFLPYKVNEWMDGMLPHSSHWETIHFFLIYFPINLCLCYSERKGKGREKQGEKIVCYLY